MFKRILPYFIALIVGAILWSLIPKCNPEPEPPSNKEKIKENIREGIKRGDSIKGVIKKNDSVRIEYVIKWRKLKADTVKIPCDSMLAKVIHTCDTIITIDSTEISNLKKVVSNDSIVIKDLFSVVRIDSIEIVRLNKAVKKERRRKRWALVLAGALGIGLIIK